LFVFDEFCKLAKSIFLKFKFCRNVNLTAAPKKIDFSGTCVGRRELYNKIK